MATYLRIENPGSDTVVIDDDHYNMAVRDHGSASIPSGGLAVSGSHSSIVRPFIAFASADYVRGSTGATTWSLSKYYGNSSAVSVDYWIYGTPPAGSPPPGAAFVAKNAANEVVFDSRLEQARVVDVITAYGEHTYPTGPAYAVAFLKNSHHRDITFYDQGGGLYTFDWYRWSSFAKVVGNKITVVKEQIAAPIFETEPAGRLNGDGGFNDAAFALLVLDVSNFEAGA